MPAEVHTEVARLVLVGFERQTRAFQAISSGAKARFERADWAAERDANRERIDLHDRIVGETVADLVRRLPEAHTDEGLWPHVKQAYIGLLYDHKRPELAETFYNSVACRVLDRTYYRNEYIFWRSAVSTEFIEGRTPTWRNWYPAREGLAHTCADIVRSFGLELPFEDPRRDIRSLLRSLRRHVPGRKERHANFQVQVLSSLFFRHAGAYIVGQIIDGSREVPFAVPIRHAPPVDDRPRALCADALLVHAEQLSGLFSLARTYFMVDMEVPSGVVAFLQRLMPRKSRSELYTSIGHHKHGKTMFYRELHENLAHSTDAFVVAPGISGLVMLVFTLPSIPWVLKVIRDDFGPQKDTTREEVRAKYVMVKYHDRVGRMPDALEYSDVALPIDRIEPALLAELERSCASVVARDGNRLVVKHLYIERRMTPLDIWLRRADEAQARHAVNEYGLAIRELAGANIFAGDLLLKNFGLTHWGRVVFYDYDEICLVTDLTFRTLPRSRNDDEEFSDEPWFPVGPTDVFPEQFLPFLFPPGRQRDLFVELHGDLLDPAWWIAQQDRIRAGGLPDLLPYPDHVRFGAGR